MASNVIMLRHFMIFCMIAVGKAYDDYPLKDSIEEENIHSIPIRKNVFKKKT